MNLKKVLNNWIARIKEHNDRRIILKRVREIENTKSRSVHNNESPQEKELIDKLVSQIKSYQEVGKTVPEIVYNKLVKHSQQFQAQFSQRSKSYRKASREIIFLSNTIKLVILGFIFFLILIILQYMQLKA